MPVFQRPHQDTAPTLIKLNLGDMNMVLAKEVETQPVHQPLFPQILAAPPGACCTLTTQSQACSVRGPCALPSLQASPTDKCHRPQESYLG